MQPILTLDHLVVAAETLAAGVAYVQDTLGVGMAAGGEHPAMATHNRLLSLGETYLEVIAINPDAPAPGGARWFALNAFRGPPRLTNWVARCGDLNAALALAPPGAGRPMALARGDLRWRMAVPDDGLLPFDGAFPGLIEWQGSAHPAQHLPGAGCSLQDLRLTHPDAPQLRDALARYDGGLERCVAPGALAFQAVITTPNGPRVLT